MRYAIKLLGLVAVTAVMVPLAEIPGFFREPRDLMPAALAQGQTAEARLAEANRLYNGEAFQLWRTGQLELAFDVLLQALELYRHPDVRAASLDESRQGEGRTLTGLGAISRVLERYEQALKYYADALVISREVNDRAGEGTILNNIGVVYDSLEQYEQALGYYTDALAIRQEVGDYRGEGVTLHNIAAGYEKLGQYEQALIYYTDALAIRQEISDHAGAGDTLNNIGDVYGNLGQYEQAVTYYIDALALRRATNDLRGEGITLNKIGVIYRNLGQYEQALTYYTDALAISRSLGDRTGEGTVLNNIGVVYRALGRYERALGYYTEALAIRQEIPDRAGEGETLSNIGVVYSNLGQHEQSLTYYTNALAIYQDIDDRKQQGTIITNIGASYLHLKQYEQALTHYTDALAIFQDLGDHNGASTTLNGIGGVYQYLGRYEEALTYYTDALGIRQDIGDRSGESTTLNNIAAVYYAQGQYNQALDTYTDALAVAQEIGKRSGEGTTLNNIGRVLEALDEPELALVFYKQSVNVRESIRGDIRGLDIALQQSFTETVADTYRRLADLLLQQNRILEAQRVLDLLKVQELDDSLRGVRSSADTASGVTFWQIETDLLALYQQVIADGDELAQLQAADYDNLSPEQQQRLATLRQRNADVQSRFITFLDRPEVRQLLAQIRQDTEGQNLEIERQHRALQNNLRALPQKTALLYPLILSDRLELVVVTADGPPLRYPIAVTGTELNRAIVAFGQALKDPSSDIQPLAQQLYTWLVAPLEAQLAQIGMESLLYAPDGALRYVPLAALHDGEQYLAERFSISHITAASLTNFDRRPEGQRRLLAAACAECSFTVNVGDRAFVFADLPYTETEVNGLAKQVPNTRVLLNQGFNRRELENRLGNYSIIHLATHGAVVENQPSQSFLVLGSGETVTLETIRNSWSLSHAELVVLSACETAVGSPELGSGVEILGLGHQIQEAGAQGVLASLWKVSDQGTQILITAFYDALAQGMTKTESLQAAQQALITGDLSAVGGDRATIDVISTQTGQPLTPGGNLAHPYYWAPFILIGNGL
ncbi:CHAT domain-containing protein [Nodosilinea sp. E11]|uniref:CHAT domain-containing protein n=1 Tax=Nodosilinea sp. E11 TaxID=3037479 RepID=UPI002934C3EF|nr:tetratricopeptide repeat protein [Nodosilinea sp. E11]WOD39786.1 tetratricopeptide repeat protein [Nodosilinea sp. E11]